MPEKRILVIDDEINLCTVIQACLENLGGLETGDFMGRGHDAKEDYHYTREGVQALFMFLNPIAGWRRVSNRDHRTRVDWAQEVCQLLDVDYPKARKIKLLCDNLNLQTARILMHHFSCATPAVAFLRVSI